MRYMKSRLICTKNIVLKHLNQLYSSEKGATLVETLVALSILMTVLVPVVGVMGILSGNHLVKDKIQALNLAQQSLEITLLQKSWSDSLYYPQEGWRVERSVSKDSSMVLIQVDVYRRDHSHPLLNLSTIRIVDSNEISSNE